MIIKTLTTNLDSLSDDLDCSNAKKKKNERNRFDEAVFYMNRDSALMANAIFQNKQQRLDGL